MVLETRVARVEAHRSTRGGRWALLWWSQDVGEQLRVSVWGESGSQWVLGLNSPVVDVDQQ